MMRHIWSTVKSHSSTHQDENGVSPHAPPQVIVRKRTSVRGSHEGFDLYRPILYFSGFCNSWCGQLDRAVNKAPSHLPTCLSEVVALLWEVHQSRLACTVILCNSKSLGGRGSFKTTTTQFLLLDKLRLLQQEPLARANPIKMYSF